MPSGRVKRDLRDLDPAELGRWLSDHDHPPYRAGQISSWLYKRPVSDIREMANLPGALREELTKQFDLYLPREVRRLDSSDGAAKLALELGDGEVVETVWMPEGKRATLCVSSQVGCRMACRFCATGRGGLIRDLSPSEMLGQVIAARETLGPITNIVLMGMGEPLDNLDGVLPALQALCDPERMAMAPGRITVSTVGIIPGLGRLGKEAPPVKLAVSIHSALQETRDRLAPGARSNKLAELKSALLSYPLPRRGKITIEYVLIGGVNDGPGEALALARWLCGLRAKVNLIPFNPFHESEFSAPDEKRVLAFQDKLRQAGIVAFIRKSRGADVMAACGQLRARVT